MHSEGLSEDDRSFSSMFKWPRVLYLGRFLAVHLICLAAIWTGISWQSILLCLSLYVIRMFWVTAGYHRYFSHRTFKMGRVMQFIMAFMAQTSAQKGVLWWAAHHRHHHKYSDMPEDVHSVRQDGFFWSHMGWIFSGQWDGTDFSRVKDLTKYPEIVWIDRYHMLPPVLLGVACFLFMGWEGLIVGFFWSTVLLWHGSFSINSLAHVFGRRRYDTTDDSKNSFLLAIITLGEGWHNNHHHYQASVNQGFFWWEVDLTYYGLWFMSKLGLVSDLKKPPRHVIENKPHPAAALREELKEAMALVREQATRRIEEMKASAAKLHDEAHIKIDEIQHAIHQFQQDAGHCMKDLKKSAAQLQEDAVKRVEELKMVAQKISDDTATMLDEFIDATHSGDNKAQAPATNA